VGSKRYVVRNESKGIIILSFFSEYLLDARAIDQEKMNKDLSLAMKKRIISREERVDVLRLDLIIEGTLLNTEEPVLVAGEISYTLIRLF
jgi:hypothetical protein